MSYQRILLASLVVLLPAENAFTEEITQENLSLVPEVRMDSGDYGGRDTITTYEFSVTAEYDLSPDMALSLRVVPYIYQDETYSDVVLVRGRPIHHADPSGTNPHSTSKHHSTDNRILQHQNSNHREDQQVGHRDEHWVEHQVTPPIIHHPEHPPIHHSKRQNNRHTQPKVIQNSQQAQTVVNTSRRSTTSQTPSPGKQVTPTRPVSYEMIEKEVMRHGSASGIGDTYFYASYRIVEETETLPETSLHAGVTIPTADEDKGQGTGEIDYRACFIVSKNIGMATVEGGLDYNVMGEPDDYDLDNYVSGFAGVTTSITDKLDMYMELSGAQAASNESYTELAAGVQLSYDLLQNSTVNIGVSKGLSDGSPDFAVLAGYSFSF